ncbi:MAG TPA: hypothetical protein VMI56_03075 [Reyranella sp.]|nr:hypothetical protein [Reyranella sp.]
MKRTFGVAILLLLAMVMGGVGAPYLPALKSLLDRQLAGRPTPPADDLDAQLRLRRAAERSVQAEQKVGLLQKTLDAEKTRVVATDVDRELNQETIARLAKELAAAREDLGKQQVALATAKATRRTVEASPSKPPPTASPLHGVKTWPDGLRCEGDMRNGHMNGSVTCRDAGNARFDGQWINDKPNGEGTLIVPGRVAYSGTWRDGCLWAGRDWITVATSKQACGRP